MSRYQASCPAEAARAVVPYVLSRLTVRSYTPSGEPQELCSSPAGFSPHPPGRPKQTVSAGTSTRRHPWGRDDEQDDADAEERGSSPPAGGCPVGAEPEGAVEEGTFEEPEAEADADAEADAPSEPASAVECDAAGAAPEVRPESVTLRPIGEEFPTRGIPKTARRSPATAVIAETTAATSPIRRPGEAPPPEPLKSPTEPLCHRSGSLPSGTPAPPVLGRARRHP
ncbi:hypothetical protein GCM10023177_39340 [Streptomyces violaceoruber]